MKKIFIHGSSGTTGLRIRQRLSGRSDIELIVLPEEKRHDPDDIALAMNQSDITFLCLPDDAAMEAVFDALDTVKMCLDVFAPMVETMRPRPENMLRAAQTGFINATDLADYLTKKGLPFRTAYKLVGQLVAHCIENHTVLEELPLAVYQSFSEIFEEDLYREIDLKTCVEKRVSAGGTGPESVKRQIEYIEKILNNSNS